MEYFSADFPKEALKEIRANRAGFTTELLESLDYVYQNAEELHEEDSDYFLHFYAMHLLAEFREKKAFPYLIALLRLPENHIDFILGDILTESLHRFLLCTFDNENLQMLFDVIECCELHDFSRLSAIKAYELLYKEGFVDQEEFISYIRSLIYEKLSDDDSYVVFTALVGCVIDRHLFQMIPDVRFLYEKGIVDHSMHGAYDSFIDWIFYEKHPEKTTYINDAIAELEQWSCFNQDRSINEHECLEEESEEIFDDLIGKDYAVDQVITPQREKTGRNDPCPCGSGKKYKKCCYGLKYNKDIVRLEDEYDLLERYPRNSPLFKTMYNEEAINIDMLVYKALHHRAIPLWVERDLEQERLGKINYLKEALDLFLDKCQKEQILSFAAYDELYMAHYRSSEWVAAFIGLIKNDDPLEITKIRKMAKNILRKFTA